jgi:hypothetical protein
MQTLKCYIYKTLTKAMLKVMQTVHNDLFLYKKTKKTIKILQIHTPEMFLSYIVLGLLFARLENSPF